MANWWLTFWGGAHLYLLVSGPVASGAYSVNPPFTHCSAQPGEMSVLRLATQATAPSPPTTGLSSSSEAGVSPRPLSPSHLCVLCLVTQSCPTLCNPMDYSPPGSSDHGILQARILEWVAMLFSRGFSEPRDRTQVFCIAGGFFTI